MRLKASATPPFFRPSHPAPLPRPNPRTNLPTMVGKRIRSQEWTRTMRGSGQGKWLRKHTVFAEAITKATWKACCRATRHLLGEHGNTLAVVVCLDSNPKLPKPSIRSPKPFLLLDSGLARLRPGIILNLKPLCLDSEFELTIEMSSRCRAHPRHRIWQASGIDTDTRTVRFQFQHDASRQ